MESQPTTDPNRSQRRQPCGLRVAAIFPARFLHLAELQRCPKPLECFCAESNRAGLDRWIPDQTRTTTAKETAKTLAFLDENFRTRSKRR